MTKAISLVVFLGSLIGHSAFAESDCTGEEWQQAHDQCQEWEGGCDYATSCSHFSNRRGSGIRISCTDGVEHMIVYHDPAAPSKVTDDGKDDSIIPLKCEK